MECPKCRAKVGIMQQEMMINTGAVHCLKCFICGFWVQTAPDTGLCLPVPSLQRPRRKSLAGASAGA